METGYSRAAAVPWQEAEKLATYSQLPSSVVERELRRKSKLDPNSYPISKSVYTFMDAEKPRVVRTYRRSSVVSGVNFRTTLSTNISLDVNPVLPCLENLGHTDSPNTHNYYHYY